MRQLDQIGSEEELFKAFRERDQKHIELPEKVNFPISFEHYLTWGEPGGIRRYLVFRKLKTQTLTGIVFWQNRQSSGPPACLCDWCHAYGSTDQINMLSVKPSSKTTIGMLLCVDLSCIQKVETTGKLSKKGFDELAGQLMTKIENFYDNNLSPSAI